MKFSSASQKDYRLVELIAMI